MQESTAQRDEAKQDLDDTIKYRRMLEENEKQLANVRSGVELKLKGRKAALDDATQQSSALAVSWMRPASAFPCCGNWKRTWTATKTRSRSSCVLPVHAACGASSGRCPPS